MPVTQTGLRLLSSLRSAGSTAAIRECPDNFFEEGEERDAFLFLRDFVLTHRAFPNPLTFRENTGVQTIRCTEPVAYYINEARKRRLYGMCMAPLGDMREAMEQMQPDRFVELCQQVSAAAARLQINASDYITLEAGLQMMRADYEEAALNSELRGIPTGFPYFDEATGGWQNEDLISVVGRPGLGKTYVLLVMAYAAWLAGYSVLFASMELGVLQLSRRLFGIHTRINPTLIRLGRLSTHTYNQLDNMMSGMINGVPFNIIQGGFRKSVSTLRAVAEATSPDLIIGDASYLLAPEKARKGGDSRRETVSDTIEDMKRLAIDLRRPVVQSLQFNRTAERATVRTDSSSTRRTNPVEHLSVAKIGETDVVGQASSIVIGVAGPERGATQDHRWLAFLKGREGESGAIKINYRFNPVNFDQVQVGFDEDEEDNTPLESAVNMI